MKNSKEQKPIFLYNYFGHHDVCGKGCEKILELLTPANAIVTDGDHDYIDMEEYDRFILSHLEKLKKEAEKDSTYAKAYDYVRETDDYFDDRRRFINLVTLSYADRCPNKRITFKRDYEFASANFRALFEHFIHAHNLLFQSTPTPADYHNPKDSKIESTDNK
ncbi:MAG: hypothetical protein J7K40_01265 [candidate division Zixibacteria bacterium]|nr:hypothetical protein [candidate division Zixibacteria bacterium]